MKKEYANVADMIFDRGAFKFGAFRLKLHEKNPSAPLSPFYLNLRTKDNPTNPGPLTDDDCDLIAIALWDKIKLWNIDFQAIAGIPHAADPIIEALERVVPKPWGFRIIKLAKEIKDGKRKIVPLPGFDYRKGENVLVIDDLVTKADSKIEAIKAIESEGSIVKKLFVLVDREQGGYFELRKAGYDMISCFTIMELLAYYLATGKIDNEKYEECLCYIENN
ncbi:MAG: Orotate phosphoribosyltransferase/orotidine 5''-phosphate decarboxylase, subfamily 1 [Candidatus Falkowbacteria bacterium GW2011_GWC2_38_22]|nr:MAG: Orotate phosphoribosyltransferase/orotidine 5''-phosphate decarboxylase, subfamily 1 [Candidatus Falkowbacteria bacterium GW2011_GWC2_38_22]KKQ72777.1 MAG: Orotate phosphoribosyltransferase/orotidine 5''-phosphate decarboxylase, subfamily 1 [Candidatus Falkowbacteria bacterium GW2011_GWD2_38_42]HAM88106.1 hypothetical protein [Candidatus Falkowbacteria bacterium]HAY12822.1 hypothetical protein [Candidatus Falkowbacteria bacterium]HBI96904.1 hypothetical protein [Candidatus Falkowbacteri